MSDRSSSILDCLKRALADAHVTLRTGRVTELLCRDGTVLGAKTEEGTYYARAVILALGKGDFTSSGHYIVLTGWEDGAFRVNDPNSRLRSQKLWTYEELEGQIRNIWEIS